MFNALRQSQQGQIVPTIFIIDEFDLFTAHNKQALLSNLSDSVQSGKNAMGVIGLTCRQVIMSVISDMAIADAKFFRTFWSRWRSASSRGSRTA